MSIALISSRSKNDGRGGVCGGGKFFVMETREEWQRRPMGENFLIW